MLRALRTSCKSRWRIACTTTTHYSRYWSAIQSGGKNKIWINKGFIGARASEVRSDWSDASCTSALTRRMHRDDESTQTAKGGRAFTVVTQTDQPVLISLVERDDCRKEKKMQRENKSREEGRTRTRRKGTIRGRIAMREEQQPRYYHGQFTTSHSALALIDLLCATSCIFCVTSCPQVVTREANKCFL